MNDSRKEGLTSPKRNPQRLLMCVADRKIVSFWSLADSNKKNRGLIALQGFLNFAIFFCFFSGDHLLASNPKKRSPEVICLIASGLFLIRVGLRLLGSVFGGCCGLLSQWCGRGTRCFYSVSHGTGWLSLFLEIPLSFLSACHLF